MAIPKNTWSPERRARQQQYWTPARRAAARAHALRGWSTTVDRTARTRAARSASPASLDYWLNQQHEPLRSAPMTTRRAAADAARRAHFITLSLSRTSHTTADNAVEEGAQSDAR